MTRLPTLKDRLEYAGYRLVQTVATLLPEVVALQGGMALGWLAGTVFRVRRRDVDANLALAFPHRTPGWRRRMASRCYRHIGREGVAMVRLSRMSPEEVRSRTEMVGFDEVEAALAEGKGIVLVTGHLGNWEVGGAAVSSRGILVDAVARPQRNPLFDRELLRTRERLGMRVIPQDQAVRRGFRSLREGRLLALVADQNVRNGGVFVEFFGSPASTARGPALFTLRAGSPLFVTAVIRQPGWRSRYRMSFRRIPVDPTGEMETDLLTLTRDHTALLQHYVERHPEQYFWPHRRWKTRPGPAEPQQPSGEAM